MSMPRMLANLRAAAVGVAVEPYRKTPTGESTQNIEQVVYETRTLADAILADPSEYELLIHELASDPGAQRMLHCIKTETPWRSEWVSGLLAGVERAATAMAVRRLREQEQEMPQIIRGSL